ncbi:MAG: hypothetical protein R3291_04870, partial [Thermoplasmata archaeon]|nr:hypothetical protein [Thermoplasmata archaeon]
MGAWVRQGLVVLLGFVALLGQSIPTLLPPIHNLLQVQALDVEAGAPHLDEGSAAALGAGSRPAGDANLDEEERAVNVTITDGDVDIGLESNATDGGDEVRVQFGSLAAELRVAFETQAPQEEEVEMRIEFRDLIEFEDRDGDGAFSLLN